MLNLSQIALGSPDYSVLGKFKVLRNPDIYFAENISDYKENILDIKYPWYKKNFLMQKDHNSIYIIFQNMGITKIKRSKSNSSKWFILHDGSGQDVVYWGSNHNENSLDVLPSLTSFKELKENQCLKEDDWVYQVFIRYTISYKIPSIVEVNKYHFSIKNPQKESLAEKVRSLIPKVFEPNLQPSY